MTDETFRICIVHVAFTDYDDTCDWADDTACDVGTYRLVPVAVPPGVGESE